MSELLLTLCFLFFLGSGMGWVLELFYRRIAGGKWINPGFLHGPYLPIYGLGLMVLFLLCRIDLTFIPYRWLQIVFLLAVMCVTMTAIEYVGGIIFIKGMGIKLWDYSDRPGNIQGVICPLFSAIWTAIGALYYFLLDDFFYHSVTWLFNNLAFSFFVGFFFGLFTVDLIKTMDVGIKIRQFAKKHDVVVRYEKLKGDVQDYLRKIKEKTHFLTPFRLPEPFENFLKKLSPKNKNGDLRFPDESSDENTEDKENKNIIDNKY